MNLPACSFWPGLKLPCEQVARTIRRAATAIFAGIFEFCALDAPRPRQARGWVYTKFTWPEGAGLARTWTFENDRLARLAQSDRAAMMEVARRRGLIPRDASVEVFACGKGTLP